MRPRHPRKEIEGAVVYAESKGWVFKSPGSSAHCWGRIKCPAGERGGCIISVWSTPSSAENHARQIKRRVDSCPH